MYDLMIGEMIMSKERVNVRMLQTQPQALRGNI